MSKYNHSEIGERIRREREKLSLSQDELLNSIRDKEKPCFGRNTLSKLENGDPTAFNAISIAKLSALCEEFECSISYLMGEYSFRNYDNKFICNKTGLSENAVQILMNWNKIANLPGTSYSWARNARNAISDLIEQDILLHRDVLNPITEYCCYRNQFDDPQTRGKQRTIALDKFRLALFTATNGLTDCIKAIYKNTQKTPDTK